MQSFRVTTILFSLCFLSLTCFANRPVEFSQPKVDSVEPHFQFSNVALYASTQRKLTLEAGYQLVLKEIDSHNAFTSIGPHFSAAISPKSYSASIGYSSQMTAQMFGAHTVQIDYSHMRMTDSRYDNQDRSFKGLEFKLGLMVFVFRFSVFDSKDERLGYFSAGVGF